jgi:hypothetical protein
MGQLPLARFAVRFDLDHRHRILCIDPPPFVKKRGTVSTTYSAPKKAIAVCSGF